MGFLVSPGVEVNEIDLTNVIPAVSTSIGGYAGHFNWGPSGELINVSSEKDLQSIFGTPDDAHSTSFLVAASFLKYGNFLKVSRAVPTGAANAVAGNDDAAVLSSPIGNLDDFEDLTNASFGDDDDEYFVARCPGSYGNSLKVIIGHQGTTNTDILDNFDYVPGDTDAAEGTETSNDEIHVLVIDEDGLFTGIPGSILEKYQGLSLASDAKLSGGSNYYKDVINNGSQYIFANSLSGVFTNADDTLGTGAISDAGAAGSENLSSGAIELSFSGGADGTQSTVEVIGAGTATLSEQGLQLFADAESVDVNLLFATPMATAANQKTIEDEVKNIAASRKDILGCGSAPIDLHTKSSDSTKLTHITANVPATTSNYFATTSSTVYVYNKYLDRYEYITTNGYLAGLCANTDDVAEPWFSPAGFNRGQILGAAKLSYNPKQGDRDTLYKAAVNPITNFPGQGIVLFGDKTFTQKPSAFDRINVRRLFMVLEKAIATAAKFQLFELNDEFTRAMFRNMTEPFLRDVKGRRGITDFLVVCDETNNTGQVIDTNRFVADIYIKPARSINFITLNFVATRTGVEFSEIVGTN
jgi:phage tail sheath protein FI